jgi:hypothetical protein
MTTLTPLLLIAGSGLSDNTGIGFNAAFALSLYNYEHTPLISNLLPVFGNAIAGNLSNAVISSLETIGATNCPALGDSVPSAYSANIPANLSGFIGTIAVTSDTYLGSGDNSKFVQIFTAAQGYVSQTNSFINSSLNGSTYLGNTFTSMNSLMTGNLTDVNLALSSFGLELAALGQAIDLSNLNNLGAPSALLQQIFKVAGITPSLRTQLIQAGLTETQINNISSPGYETTNTVEKLIYKAMTKVTNNNSTDLSQILLVLGVTTKGLTSLADLLNPVKIFPKTFQSLTVKTGVGLRAIYIDAKGTVNTNLLKYLPSYVITTPVT